MSPSELKERHDVVGLEDGGSKIVIGNVEIFDSWDSDVGDVEGPIAGADVIDEVRFVTLDKVEQWKPERGREKDLLDLQLIERHRET